MKYIYFITYECARDRNGNARVIYGKKIKSVYDVRNIEENIEKKYDLKNVIITNYKLLRSRRWY